MNILEWLGPAYVGIGIGAVFMGVMLFAIDPPPWIEDLGTEGRCVLGGIAGALWPLVALVSLFVALCALARGLIQVVRFVRPRRRRADVPRAEVRRP